MFNKITILTIPLLLIASSFSHGNQATTLSMLKNTNNYQITDNYTQLVVVVATDDLASGQLTMTIDRQTTHDNYTFSGKLVFAMESVPTTASDQSDIADFSYSFTVENGQLRLPTDIEQQTRLIHQVMFTQLAEIITTQLSESNYLKYSVWVPLVTDLSLDISDVRIMSSAQCPDPNYQLTTEQVKQYFLLSTEYTYINQYLVNDYDTYGCNISGTLRNHDKLVDFSIDMGGLGYLDNRRFGCAAGRCKAFGLGSDGQLAGN